MRKLYKISIFIFFILTASLLIAFRPSQIGGGAYYYIVSSGSMEPSLNVGDWIICTKTSFSSLNSGDIIAFRHPSEPDLIVVHRIVEKTDTYIITKGDACEGNDNFKLYPQHILAVYTGIKLPLVGSILYWSNHTLIGLITVYYIPIAILLCIQVPRLYRILKSKNKQ
jgi:signal peptidase I